VLKDAYENILGDVIVSAGTISYLGPFTSDFRAGLVGQWQEGLVQLGIPHTKVGRWCVGCLLVGWLMLFLYFVFGHSPLPPTPTPPPPY
jgi:dynein heavy chain